MNTPRTSHDGGLDALLADDELLELIGYHGDAVRAACRGGVSWKSHSLIQCHGREFHRLAEIGEARGIYQRPPSI